MANISLNFIDFTNNITIHYDQQEKRNYHILNYYKNVKIPVIKEHFKAGDYGFSINGIKQSILIERKDGLHELSGNLSAERTRFYKEFDKIQNCDKYLLIENDNIDNLLSSCYGTNFHTNSFTQNLLLLQKRHNIFIHFVNKFNMGYFMLRIFYSYYYELLKGD